MEEAVTSPKVLSWFNVALAVGPIVLSVGLAYGTTRFTQGETQNKINTIEKRQEQNVTREELKIFMDNTRDDLREIKDNIKELRKDIRESR